jgi:hypothetical protein
LFQDAQRLGFGISREVKFSAQQGAIGAEEFCGDNTSPDAESYCRFGQDEQKFDDDPCLFLLIRCLHH